MQGHTDSIRTLAVTTDNKYVISGSDDYTIRIWNFFERREETVFTEHLGSIRTVVVTNDNKYIISGSYDKTIRI